MERRYTLSKAERLSWKRYIDLLFTKGDSFVAYPLRVVYLPIEEDMGVPASILISVSKKKLKHAVKRNRIKRLIREAYRTQKLELTDHLQAADKRLLVGFLYLEKELASLDDMEKAMAKAIRLLKEKNP